MQVSSCNGIKLINSIVMKFRGYGSRILKTTPETWLFLTVVPIKFYLQTRRSANFKNHIFRRTNLDDKNEVITEVTPFLLNIHDNKAISIFRCIWRTVAWVLSYNPVCEQQFNRYTNEQIYGPQSIVQHMSQYICPN